jgi:hypothetical protein
VLYDFYAGDHVDENVFAYSNRVDTHRALVLYHNSHTTTAGWIKESVAFLGMGEEEGGRLDRILLADALRAPDEEGCYLAFRDQTEGLEYLRSTRELREMGLYVELKEYQFHVFLDFREIHDEVDGSWQQLYAHLNGSGVDSLDESRKQLRYGELNAAFRAIFERQATEEITAAIALELQQVVDLFLRAAADDNAQAAVSTAKRKISRKKNTAIEQYVRFTELSSHKTTASDARSFLLRLGAGFSDQADRSLLLAWLVLRETTLDPVSRGLDYTLKDFLQRDDDPDFGGRAPQLLSALLEWWRSGKRNSSASSLQQMQSLFELEASQAYVLHHESDGVEWFNKERFEELFEWLSLLLLLEGCTSPSARTITTRMGEAERTIVSGMKRAQDTGYRSRLFSKLPEKTVANQKPPIKKSLK